MISIPATDTLLPICHSLSNGWNVLLFPSTNTDLVKIDLLFEAGSAYQQEKLCAAAANKMQSVATRTLNAARMAEFMDYRGVVVETSNDTFQSSLTVYMLRRFVPEVLPVIYQMLSEPAFEEEDFVLWKNKKRQELATLEQKTPEMARRIFYQNLFGTTHPLGSHATVEDLEALSLDTVICHHRLYYQPQKCTLVISGQIDDEMLALIENFFAQLPYTDTARQSLPPVVVADIPSTASINIPNSTQTTLRIGRILPLRWDDPDYARIMLITTLLGGHFGSRLMSNIREEKGYTYGIYARTQIYRGCIVFYITSDVAPHIVDSAEKEILHELDCLQQITERELQQVKTILAGDFIRSVDGVFERSVRFCDMLATCVNERLTDNLREVIDTAKPSDLEKLAVRLLAPGMMTVCRAGQEQ